MAMFSLSYHRRLFLWLVGYSLLMMAMVMAYQYRRERQFKADELNARLQLINAFVMAELDDGTLPEQIKIDEFHPFNDLRLTVISPDGIVLYDNSLDSLPHSNHLDRQEIAQAIAQGNGFALRRHSSSTGATYSYAATRGPQGIIVRTAVPYSVGLNELLHADRGFLWVMGAIAVLMCVIGYVATRRVGDHVSRLSRFAAGVERGETISNTDPFPHDELGEISNHIVRLYARLQQANIDRDREHRLALHEQREKERIKKQLTNNINHELKTPVASIQVCVETLLAHDNLSPEKQRDFLERALANTTRLKQLLADVATLTRLEDGLQSIEHRAVNLTELIAEVANDSRLPAADHGMSIDNRALMPMTIMGNASLMESVFHNLIDNAIAYSGGSVITINATKGHGTLTIIVADNGCGLEPEHLPRIFERFYRVDKGRSRAAGGTGLGLSIAKNAVVHHGGTISVANRPGGGLLFTITLPSSAADEDLRSSQ